MQRRVFAFDAMGAFKPTLVTLLTILATAASANPASASDSNAPPRDSADDIKLVAEPVGPSYPAMLDAPGGTRRQPGVFGMNIELQAVLPVGFGGALMFEGPAGVRAGIGVGGTPTALIGLGLDTVRPPGSWTQRESNIITDAMEAPMYVRVNLALAPPVLQGFYLGASYGFVRAAVALLAGDVPRDLWPKIGGLNEKTYAGLSVIAHHVAAEVGWEFGIDEHWRLRATVGAIVTFASDAEVSVNRLTKVQSEEKTSRQIADAEKDIEDAVVKYGTIPSVTLTLSYRIF